jgi:hypothetical protein
LKEFTDFDSKIESLLLEVAAEKKIYRYLNQKKLKELHKNYGQEENEFENKLHNYE